MKTVRWLIAMSLVVGTGVASAAATYCSAPGGNTAGLSTQNVTYSVNGPPATTNYADDCFGLLTGGPGGNATAAVINNQNIWGGGWFGLVGADAGKTGTGTGLGYNWTLTGAQGALAGTWTLSVSNWPVNTTETFDFLVSLKGGSQGAALYFFDNVSFDGSGGGSWSVSFLNSGGQTPNLSNLRVFGRAGSCVTNCGEGGGDDNFEVPAPGTLALAGLALLGVAAAGRRRRS